MMATRGPLGRSSSAEKGLSGGEAHTECFEEICLHAEAAHAQGTEPR